VTTINDMEEYAELIKSMDTLNVKGPQRHAFWRVIGAVLHTAGIDYDDSTYDGSSSCQVKSKASFSGLAHTLQVDEDMLFKALTTRTSIVVGQEVIMYLDKNGCDNQAEAFAKEIYSKMFDWIIKYLNLALLPASLRGTNKDPETIYRKIGLLDIFGFEIFAKNSIEQLCINFTNEKLHQLYVEYVFKLEQKTFIDEGLKEFLANLSFNDNQEVIDLLAHEDKKKFSIFNLIDDQSATMANDMNLI
jgi:myosin heavy subunit